MAVIVVNSGLVPKQRVGALTYQAFYKKTADIKFSSRAVKPYPLSPTAGSLVLTFRNDQNVLAPNGKDVMHAYHLYPSATYITDGPGNDSGLMNNALANLVPSSIDLLVALMELPQTLEMLASAAEAAIRAAKLFSKGQIIAGFKALGQYEDMGRRLRGRVREADRLKKRTIESSFLEAQFGWQPFISDVQGGLEALNKTFANGISLRRTSSNFQVTRADIRRDKTGFGFKSGSIVGFASGTSYTIGGVVTNSELVALQSLGFVNPFSAMWEITPYSFLVDYFVGVGDFIGALTGRAGISSMWGCRTTRSKSSRLASDLKNICYTNVTIKREVVSVRVSFPGSKLAGFSTEKAANIAALVRQHVRNLR